MQVYTSRIPHSIWACSQKDSQNSHYNDLWNGIIRRHMPLIEKLNWIGLFILEVEPRWLILLNQINQHVLRVLHVLPLAVRQIYT